MTAIFGIYMQAFARQSGHTDTVFSQTRTGGREQQRVKPVILINNTDKMRLYKIGKNSIVRVVTKDKTLYQDAVQRIHADTMVLQSSAVIRTEEIRYLGLGVSFSLKQDTLPHRIIYSANSDDSQMIFPPDSVYKNKRAFSQYFSDVLYHSKKEWKEKTYPLVFKNFLKFNLAKLAHFEIAFAYERLISKKFTWETELSYICGIPDQSGSKMIFI